MNKTNPVKTTQPLDLATISPPRLRRNVIVEGADLSALIGQRFTLQGIELEGTEECRPCYWMDQAIGEGAETWLKGRGGLRCRILTDGVLRRDGAGRADRSQS